MQKSNSKIYALKIDLQMEDALYYQLLTNLTSDRQNKVKKFQLKQDAIRCIFGDLLARYAIQNICGCTFNEIKIQIGNYGKPTVSFPYNVHFNISHAGFWVVCIVDEKPVGIDVEKIHDIDLDIARLFFTKDEYNYIMVPATIEERNRRFFQMWTLKECYVKAVGEGLSKSLQSFSVQNIYNHPVIYDRFLKWPITWQLNLWDLDGGYILSAASHSKPIQIIFLEFGEFIKKIRKSIEI